MYPMVPWDPNVVPNEIDTPVTMFDDGSMMVHTENQCNCLEHPKAPHVVRSAILDQTGAY